MTQIKHINTGIAELIAVKVPEQFDDPTVETNQSEAPYTKMLCFIGGEYKGLKQTMSIDLPEGNWSLLGIAHELTEDVWIKILESETEDGDAPYYEDYSNTSTGSYFNTATESGLSLLAANEIYAVNPYEDKEELDDGNFFGLVDAVIHKQAQGNTGKWVLLKKKL